MENSIKRMFFLLKPSLTKIVFNHMNVFSVSNMSTMCYASKAKDTDSSHSLTINIVMLWKPTEG